MSGTPRTHVVIHRFELERPEDEVAALRTLLSDDERARVDRLLFPAHRTRWTVARAELRLRLGAALGQPPEQVRFDYGERGKPSVAGLEFNLSHCRGLALLGISDGAPIGVDVEGHRELIHMDRVAERSFSVWEYGIWREQPDALRHPVFFACWTRKEAVIKALGLGMAYPLKDFDVELRHDEPVRIRHFADPAETLSEWSLHDLPIDSGYSAALAARTAPEHLTFERVGAPGG